PRLLDQARPPAEGRRLDAGAIPRRAHALSVVSIDHRAVGRSRMPSASQKGGKPVKADPRYPMPRHDPGPTARIDGPHLLSAGAADVLARTLRGGPIYP